LKVLYSPAGLQEIKHVTRNCLGWTTAADGGYTPLVRLPEDLSWVSLDGKPAEKPVTVVVPPTPSSPSAYDQNVERNKAVIAEAAAKGLKLEY
jgi:hypothetical protein